MVFWGCDRSNWDGKSALVTSECNKHPGGVLYYYACEPQVFSKRLAEAIGMKIGPLNILRFIAGVIFIRCFCVLPFTMTSYRPNFQKFNKGY